MKYAIKNTSGQWWTGECWGVEQAREEYAEDEFPIIIDLDNVDGGYAGLSPFGEPTDWLYCAIDGEGEVVASVYEVK